MKKQGTVKLTKALSYIAIVLIFASVCGFVAYFTNGFTSDFKSFYVECNGEKILSNKSGYVLAPSQPLTVDVKYVFSALSAEKSGYTLKIIPNVDAESDFDFTVDGGIYNFGSETDLSKGFNIEYSESAFTIAPKGQMEDVLAGIYPESEVTVDKVKLNYDNDLFMLVITSYNGEASVSISFKISDCMVSGITLDKEELVF